MTKEIVLTNLEVLAKEIKTEYTLAYQAMRKGVEHALKVGELLLQAKELVKHGEWYQWIEENCDFTPRHALNYMRVARYKDRFKSEMISGLTSLRAGMSVVSVLEVSDESKRKPNQKILDRVLQKAADESLPPERTAKAAAIIFETDDPVKREELLQTTLSKIHRDCRSQAAKERAKRKIERKKRLKLENENYSVKKYLDALNGLRNAIPEAKDAAEFGKFSPEAMAFTQRRHDKVKQELDELDEVFRTKVS